LPGRAARLARALSGVVGVIGMALVDGAALAQEPQEPQEPPAERLPPVDVAPPGTPGPKGLGFPFRRRGHTGFGLVTGTLVTGVSVQTFLSDHDALGATFGLSTSPFPYGARDDLAITLDWTRHGATLWESEALGLGWHLGLSARGAFGSRDGEVSAGVGLAAVGGLELIFHHVPVDVTLQYRPGIIAEIRPSAGLGYAYGDAVVMARWWFR
jgi:hypothetical protein